MTSLQKSGNGKPPPKRDGYAPDPADFPGYDSEVYDSIVAWHSKAKLDLELLVSVVDHIDRCS